jgi:hypothetical protein
MASYFYFALKNIKLLCSLNLVKEWASKTWEQALEDVMLLVFKLRSEENCNAVLGVGPYRNANQPGEHLFKIHLFFNFDMVFE